MKKSPYNNITTASLTILWLGALLFCASMLYSWNKPEEVSLSNKKNALSLKNIFVDQLLLSSQYAQLGSDVNLININLNSDPGGVTQDTTISTTSARKIIYSKILTRRIKEISTKKSDGFTIKPLPQ